MIFINLITLFFVALISVIYFRINSFIKNSYSIKVYFVLYRVAKRNPEFVKDFSLGILAGSILGLFAAPNIFVAIVCFASIILSGTSALKANYILQKHRKDTIIQHN